jgi:hypothetical protein
MKQILRGLSLINSKPGLWSLARKRRTEWGHSKRGHRMIASLKLKCDLSVGLVHQSYMAYTLMFTWPSAPGSRRRLWLGWRSTWSRWNSAIIWLTTLSAPLSLLWLASGMWSKFAKPVWTTFSSLITLSYSYVSTLTSDPSSGIVWSTFETLSIIWG